jgi:hypothetical protein
MTGIDHEHSESVILAAQWLAEEREPPSPVIPYLKERFNISTLQACEACALANSFRSVRRAFG